MTIDETTIKDVISSLKHRTLSVEELQQFKERVNRILDEKCKEYEERSKKQSLTPQDRQRYYDI